MAALLEATPYRGVHPFGLMPSELLSVTILMFRTTKNRSG